MGSSTGVDGTRVCYVRDNGAGFDLWHASSLIDPFQQLVIDGGEGAGIGLARAKRIAMKHGGRDWAESTQGQGASFYFTLAPAEAVLPAPAALPVADRAS